MITNFVLIQTKPGKECDVYDELLKIPEIIEYHQLFGEYDLIAKIEAENIEKAGQIIIEKIRTIKNVIDTKTLLGLNW
ncbi:Lrp/AsnC ligand binding domain-containing protein [[Eubacterium] cellulosolvens]